MELLAYFFLLALIAPLLARRRAARRPGAHVQLVDPAYDPSAVEEWLAARTGDARHAKHLPRGDAFRLYLAGLLADAAGLAADTPGVGDEDEDGAPRPIHFKPDEPQTFDTFEGQTAVITPLQKAVLALQDAPRRTIDHRLLTGPPGHGKTLIAKVLGHELDRRARALGLAPVPFLEYFGANLNSVRALDAAARDVLALGGGTVFIDEIHVLDPLLGTKLYSWMEEGRYPFEGDAQPTPMPETTLLGATTDEGRMHPALKRRFGDPLRVRPFSAGELFALVTRLDVPIQDGAAQLLVDRTWRSGAPYEIKGLFREAVTFARAARRNTVTEQDVREMLETYEIDDYGLRWLDREVLRALFRRPRYLRRTGAFVAFAASESDLCQVARVDRSEFQQVIRPRLMARGLLEVLAGYGLALTPEAVRTYARLRPVEPEPAPDAGIAADREPSG